MMMPLLIADDDPEDRFLLKESLRQNGIVQQLYFVEDGAQALAFLRHEPPFQDVEMFPYPGMVLVDLNMPKLSGLEVLKEIRNDPNLAIIPVVVLTTSKQDEDLVRSYGAGANSFISKPMDFSELVKVMGSLKDYWFETATLPKIKKP